MSCTAPYAPKTSLNLAIPPALDGRNIIEHYWFVDGQLKQTPYGRLNPWLHFYLAAGSMAIFGCNTFAARFPFALIGFLVIICLYLFLRRHEKEGFITQAAIILLCFNIPFFLHMRQCRYYSPAALFNLLGAWGYLDFYRTGRKRYFILYAILLFLSLQSTFVILMLAAGVHSLIRFDKERFKGLIISGIWMALVVVPVSIPLKLWQRPLDLLGWETRISTLGSFFHFINYLLYINDYIFPFLLVVVFIIWGLKRKIFSRPTFARGSTLLSWES